MKFMNRYAQDIYYTINWDRYNITSPVTLHCLPIDTYKPKETQEINPYRRLGVRS